MVQVQTLYINTHSNQIVCVFFVDMEHTLALRELQEQVNLQVTELIECDAQIKTLEIDLDFANEKLSELKTIIETTKHIPREFCAQLVDCIKRSRTADKQTFDVDVVDNEHAQYVHELLRCKKKLKIDYDNLVDKNFTAEVELEEKQRALNSMEQKIAERTNVLETLTKNIESKMKLIDLITNEHTVLQNQLDAVQTELNNGISERGELNEEITKLYTVMLEHQHTVQQLHLQIESLQKEASQKLRTRQLSTDPIHVAAHKTEHDTAVKIESYKDAIRVASVSQLDSGQCLACAYLWGTLKDMEQDISNMVESLEFILNRITVDVVTALTESRISDPPSTLSFMLPTSQNGSERGEKDENIARVNDEKDTLVSCTMSPDSRKF